MGHWNMLIKKYDKTSNKLWTNAGAIWRRCADIYQKALFW